MSNCNATVFVRVDYEEYQPETYQGVTAEKITGGPFHRINTGNVEADLKAMSQYLKSKGHNSYFHTSSIDDYFMDLNED